jgi:hypothetical protein
VWVHWFENESVISYFDGSEFWIVDYRKFTSYLERFPPETWLLVDVKNAVNADTAKVAPLIRKFGLFHIVASSTNNATIPATYGGAGGPVYRWFMYPPPLNEILLM